MLNFITSYGDIKGEHPFRTARRQPATELVAPSFPMPVNQVPREQAAAARIAAAKAQAAANCRTL